MSLVTVNFDASGLLLVLESYDRHGKNLRDAMGLIAGDLVERVEENFATEGASSPAGSWDVLAESTLMRRRKKGLGAKILQDTGAMAGSVMPEYGNLYAEAYTNDPKAPFHTSDAPREVIPLRDFMSVDLAEVQEDATNELLAQIVGA